MLAITYIPLHTIIITEKDFHATCTITSSVYHVCTSKKSVLVHIPSSFTRTVVCVVMTELLTTQVYWPNVSVVSVLVTLSMALLVITSSFLIQEILWECGYPPSALHKKLTCSPGLRNAPLGLTETVESSVH